MISEKAIQRTDMIIAEATKIQKKHNLKEKSLAIICTVLLQQEAFNKVEDIQASITGALGINESKNGDLLSFKNWDEGLNDEHSS